MRRLTVAVHTRTLAARLRASGRDAGHAELNVVFWSIGALVIVGLLVFGIQTFMTRL